MAISERISKEIHIRGIVQGVGFRPFVYKLATQHDLTGWVRNSSAGVDIIINGNSGSINKFLETLQSAPPPLSKIDHFVIQDSVEDAFTDFQIIFSNSIMDEFMPISPDIAICDDCQKELFDPGNRRFRHPFINCTNCGPRFSIIKDIPYDRPSTTMGDFPMCPECQMEYDDPSNRRFHAQPVACPNCGPTLWFESQGNRNLLNDAAIQTAREYLKSGKIIALKGIGGFHLACDAANPQAVNRLRVRKGRSGKPFALMAFDIQTVGKYCFITPFETDLLASKEKPIVLLQKRDDLQLPDSIAPGHHTLGMMLPYTPLHLLLLEPDDTFPDLLVMTSGNISEEPIAYTNPSASEDLAAIADGFLVHDRHIHIRTDDSVVTVFQENPYFFRRSRGYAPLPIRIADNSASIFAAGAELKNTFCLTRGEYAFISHHIGDLDNLKAYQSYRDGIRHYQEIYRIIPNVIACDLHPDYMSTRYAIERSKEEGIPLVQVQHHHAHFAACLADNQWSANSQAIGVCLDGTGLGTDGHIWGGEFLVGDYNRFSREFHLEYLPLPGGDSATRHPDRIAAAYLWKMGIPWDDSLPAMQSLGAEKMSILRSQMENNINCPITSSMGRLFDAVSGLLGICQDVTYEAQAAIELEHAASQWVDSFYEIAIEDDKITTDGIFSGIISDINNHMKPEIIASKFHRTISNIVLDVCTLLRKTHGINHVALSGGVWQNMLLLSTTLQLLNQHDFLVLVHRQTPPNDGCISLGQAMIAQKSND